MAMTAEDMNYQQAVAKYRKHKEEEQLHHERYKAQSSAAAATAVVLISLDDSDVDSAFNQLQPSSSVHHTPQSDQPSIATPKRQLPKQTTPMASDVFLTILSSMQLWIEQGQRLVRPL